MVSFKIQVICEKSTQNHADGWRKLQVDLAGEQARYDTGRNVIVSSPHSVRQVNNLELNGQICNDYSNKSKIEIPSSMR